MTHKEKLDKMFKELPQKGIRKNKFAPPLYRLLWRMGIKIPPPHFSSFIFLFIFLGLLSGIFWGLLIWPFMWLGVKDQHNVPPIMFAMALVPISVFFGICFGLLLAMNFRRQAKKYNLPLWSDYGKDEKREF